ncbi:protein ALP1-like [Stegodyphus dumicola]|nr:protein ALP1-like [Stegodyphus dumicola]
MRTDYPELFFNYFRMSIDQFDRLAALVSPLLIKNQTNMRAPLSPEERLSICLRHLATGNSYSSLAYSFRVGKSTVGVVVPETCNAIWTALQPVYLKEPEKSDYERIAVEYGTVWDFPNCVGAVDGKHVVIQAPAHAGSTYFNYKGSHSIVLMAACDASYLFTMVDIGNFGRISDGGIFSASNLGKKLSRDKEFLPGYKKLPKSSKCLPHVFVGDEAFGLKENFMRPYSGRNLSNSKRIFNYRLSRARRCIENTFGILTARWRILRNPIIAQPQTATLVVQACCCLHNFLMKYESISHNYKYCPPNFADRPMLETANGLWRDDTSPNNGLVRILRLGNNNYSFSSGSVRDLFCSYFENEGALSWQNKRIGLTVHPN